MSEDCGSVIDCAEFFLKRHAEVEVWRAKREKQQKLLEDYRIKDPNKPSEPIPDSEQVPSLAYVKAIVSAADSNLKMLATELDRLQRAHNALAKYTEQLHGTVGKLFSLNHNLIIELSKSGIPLNTSKSHFFQTYQEIKAELDGN
jgi:hypothetical protein